MPGCRAPTRIRRIVRCCASAAGAKQEEPAKDKEREGRDREGEGAKTPAEAVAAWRAAMSAVRLAREENRWTKRARDPEILQDGSARCCDSARDPRVRSREAYEASHNYPGRRLRLAADEVIR